jgi:hypothetical protein
MNLCVTATDRHVGQKMWGAVHDSAYRTQKPRNGCGSPNWEERKGVQDDEISVRSMYSDQTM